MNYQDKISRTISQFIYSQLPATIHLDFEKPLSGKTDRTLFTRFLEVYYEFLEQNVLATLADKSNNSIGISQSSMIGEFVNESVPGLHGELMRLTGYRDVDLIKDDLKYNLYNEFLYGYTGDLLGDRDRLLKIANLLNRSKGTALSYDILFRFAYNVTAKFVEPAKEIFKLSSNKYHIETRMRIQEIDSSIEPSKLANFSEFAGTYVVGRQTGARAYVLNSDHESNIKILDTAPVITVLLGSGGTGYKIPGSLDPAEDGLSLLKSYDNRYSNGVVSTLKSVFVGSGYERILKIELFENNQSGWAKGDVLLPMANFDETTEHSFAGWNIQSGMGKIETITTVGSKSIYHVVTSDPTDTATAYWNSGKPPEFSPSEKVVPAELVIPPEKDFWNIPITYDAESGYEIYAYQGTTNVSDVVTSKTADGKVAFYGDERALTLGYDDTNANLYKRTQRLVLDTVDTSGFTIGGIVEHPGQSAQIIQTKRGKVLSWDSSSKIMWIELLENTPGVVTPFTRIDTVEEYDSTPIYTGVLTFTQGATSGTWYSSQSATTVSIYSTSLYGTGATFSITTDSSSVVTVNATPVTAGVGFSVGDTIVLQDPSGYTNATVTLTVASISAIVGQGTISTANGTKLFYGATAVDPSTDQITITAHGFLTGNLVVYRSGASAITGLTSSVSYYVIKVDDDILQLATSSSNAIAGTEIDITADGSNDAHSLTGVGFDVGDSVEVEPYTILDVTEGNSTEFTVGAEVVQEDSSSRASGIISKWDTANNKLYVIDVNGSFSTTSTTPLIDGNNLKADTILTATVVSGGSGYAVDDTVSVDDNGAGTNAILTVATISGGGSTGPVVTFDLIGGATGGTGYSATTGESTTTETGAGSSATVTTTVGGTRTASTVTGIYKYVSGIVKSTTDLNTASSITIGNLYSVGDSWFEEGDPVIIRGTETNDYIRFVIGSSTSSAIVRSVTIAAGGTGYDAGSLTFTGGSPTTPATGTYTVDGGVIDTITITNFGSGYDSAPTVTGGSNTGAATLTAVLSNMAVASGYTKVNIEVLDGSFSVGSNIKFYKKDAAGTELDTLDWTDWTLNKIYYQLKEVTGLNGTSVVKSITTAGSITGSATTYGTGSGLIVDYTTRGDGGIVSATASDPGIGYLVGDKIYILSNVADAYKVGGLSSGAVLTGVSGNNGIVTVTSVNSFGGVTGLATLTSIATTFTQTGTNLVGDINKDGVVDLFDLVLAARGVGSGYSTDGTAVITSYGNGSGLVVDYDVARNKNVYEIDIDTLTPSTSGTDYQVHEEVNILHNSNYTLGGVEVTLDDVAGDGELILTLQDTVDDTPLNDDIIDKIVTQHLGGNKFATGTVRGWGPKKLILSDINSVSGVGYWSTDPLFQRFTSEDFGGIPDWKIKKIEMVEQDSIINLGTVTGKVVSQDHTKKTVVVSNISNADLATGFAVDDNVTPVTDPLDGIAHEGDDSIGFKVKSIGNYQVAHPQNGTRIAVSGLASVTATKDLYGGIGTDATVDYTTTSSGGISSFTLNAIGKDYKVGDELTIRSSSTLPAETVGGNSRKLRVNKIQATGIAGLTYFKESTGEVSTTASGLTLDYVVNSSGVVTSVAINNPGVGYKEDDTGSSGDNKEEVYLVPTIEDKRDIGLNGSSTNAVIKITDTDNIILVESAELSLRNDIEKGPFGEAFSTIETITAQDKDGNDIKISNSENVLRAKVEPVISGATITNGGIGYRVGEEAAELDASGVGGSVAVSAVSTGPVESIILDSNASNQGSSIGATHKIGFSIRYIDIYGFAPTKTGSLTSYADITTEFEINSTWNSGTNYGASLSTHWPSGDVFSNYDRLSILREGSTGTLYHIVKFENISTNKWRLWLTGEIKSENISVGKNYIGKQYHLSYAHNNLGGWLAGMIYNGTNGNLNTDQGWIESDLGYTGATDEKFAKPVATCYGSEIKTVGPRVPQAIIESYANNKITGIELLDEGDGYSDFPLAYAYNTANDQIDKMCKLYSYSSKIGSIIKTEVKNIGLGYTGNDIAFGAKSAPGGNDGTGYPTATATGTLLTSPIFTSKPRAIDNIGFTDGTQILRDPDVYNDFSYVLESSISPEIYKDMLEKTIHPVGFRSTPKYVYAGKPDSHTKSILVVEDTIAADVKQETT
tara:strand:- start:19158 stop:25595 length:6438 start_codon:yes stop_codon:yes gene_type:complete